jgi:hypothetical protein
MSWGSSANSDSSDISSLTDAGEIPANANEALDIEGDSSDDDGDPALSDNTAEDFQGVEDAAWVPSVPSVNFALRQPRTMYSRPRMLMGFISRAPQQASIQGKGLLVISV